MIRSIVLHIAVIAGLFLIESHLLEHYAYHHGNLARILVLATYAVGYNILFGYTGLLSLGHAMFFAAGMYGCALLIRLGEWSIASAFLVGILCALALGLVVGFLALRTIGVGFMIVTLMFAQSTYLTALYYNEYTRGDEGFSIPQAVRSIGNLDLTDPTTRYYAALILFSTCLLISLALVQSKAGRVLVAIRENEDRTRMLGFNPFRYKLFALVASAGMAGAAGAAYAVLFGYAGATFASVQYSIFPLLWVLLGGPGTTLGPLLGTILMFYLVDLASGSIMPGLAALVENNLGIEAPGLASAYLLLVGLALVLLVLFAPKGLLGSVRERWVTWLP